MFKSSQKVPPETLCVRALMRISPSKLARKSKISKYFNYVNPYACVVVGYDL